MSHPSPWRKVTVDEGVADEFPHGIRRPGRLIPNAPGLSVRNDRRWGRSGDPTRCVRDHSRDRPVEPPCIRCPCTCSGSARRGEHDLQSDGGEIVR